MSKHKASDIEDDEEFMTQLDFSRVDYGDGQLQIEESQKDIHRLIAVLIKRDIPVPDDILERYVKNNFMTK